MTTTEFLAVSLMGWDLVGGWWVKPANPEFFPEGNYLEHIHREDDYNPTSINPPGPDQCFGPGGVVEKMRERGWICSIYIRPNKICRVVFEQNPSSLTMVEVTWPFAQIDADTITVATCEAARKALETEGEKGG